jgi:hypothetical protein
MPATPVNEDWYRNSTLRMEAEGYQWRDTGHGPRKTLSTAASFDTAARGLNP